MSMRNSTRPVPTLIAASDEPGAPAPSAMLTIAALLAAANAYVAGATIHAGAALAWLVPGLFLVSVRPWRAIQAFSFGCLFGIAIGLGQGVASGSTIDVLAGSLLSTPRIAALLCSALPFGLMALVYAGLGQNMPSSARGSFAAWLWPGAELLRSLLVPGVHWVDLGGTQHLGTLVASFGEQTPRIVSFVMVLVSCTAVELLQNRTSWRAGSRPLLRWIALPTLAIAALWFNMSTMTPTTAAPPAGQVMTRSRTMSERNQRRVVDRPVLTSGAVLTAI